MDLLILPWNSTDPNFVSCLLHSPEITALLSIPTDNPPIQATCLIFLQENDLILLTSTLPTTAHPHCALQCSQKDVFKI